MVDKVLLDEDIGGFVRMLLYNSIEDIKDNSYILVNLFIYRKSIRNTIKPLIFLIIHKIQISSLNRSLEPI